MKSFILATLVFCAGALYGNLDGDQKTIRDCATKNAAKMAGGGSIKCEVVKTLANN